MRYCVLTVLFLLLAIGMSAAGRPRMRHICASPDGTNTLTWYRFPDTCNKVLALDIFARENAFSPYKNIATLSGSTTSYSHAGSNNFQKGEYFLRYTIRCGGNAVNVFSDTLLVDTKPPAVIDPDSVSVDKTTGRLIMGWTPPADADVKGYVIYRVWQGGNFPVDTLRGKGNTFYADKGIADPSSRSERYRIAPFDSCDNIAPIGNDQHTIFLQSSSDKCKEEIYLRWNSYRGWTGGVERYDVFVKTTGGFKKTASSGTDTFFTFSASAPGLTYTFFVRAFQKRNADTISSTSNFTSAAPGVGDSLQYLYISLVTRQGNDARIEWLAAQHPDLDHFELWRGRDKAHLVKLMDLPKTALTFTDPSPEEVIWHYRVIAYSKCGHIIGQSNISNTIVLQSAVQNGHRILSWNPYASWLNGVSKYEVYRITHGADTAHLLPLGITDRFTTTFLDTTTIAYDTLPGACYHVEAVEGGINKFGVKGISSSNAVCYANPPIVFIPNAFTPYENINIYFRPSLLNVIMEGSALVIYNRWGQRIGQHIDLRRGWDGRMADGNICPEGVYYYELSILGLDGSRKVYHGTVSLL